VIKGVYWGGDFETVIAMLKNGTLSPDKIRFYIGYSGWSDGQLNNELQEKSWLTVAGTRKLIFHRNYQEIWKDSLKTLGGDYEMMINFPIDPQLN
jgi:putative transcriptional regulator